MAANVDYVARVLPPTCGEPSHDHRGGVDRRGVALVGGGGSLLRQGVAHATTQWQHGVNVDAFLVAGISPAQKNVIDHELLQFAIRTSASTVRPPTT